MNDDQRIEAILELIMNLAAGNLTARAEQSEAGDTIDGVIEGLNMLAEELTHSVETGKFFEALAYHDYLTKLPNRVLFEERLTHACARVKRTESHLVLLFLDLNEFKPINDQWGHHVGDLMLKHVAKQMNSIVRDYDTVARIGGDEFAVILEDFDRADIDEIVERLADAIASPMHHDGRELIVEASIGIAEFPRDAEAAMELLTAADKAMYRAKRRGVAYATAE